jgi:hypothetical protein
VLNQPCPHAPQVGLVSSCATRPLSTPAGVASEGVYTRGPERAANAGIFLYHAPSPDLADQAEILLNTRENGGLWA